MKIKYLNKEYELIRDISESDFIYNIRLNFIKKNASPKMTWKEIVKYSKIYINITYLGCKYPKYVYSRVIKMKTN